MNFIPPVEFDINIYRNKNQHLQNMTDNELINHYNMYGSYEGLCASEISNRYDFINLISQDKDILEIGPLAFPCMNINLPNIKTIDYFSQDELKENYKNDPNVNIDKIGKVSYIIKDNVKYLDIINERFDFVFSSHNIEHVPCFITFLNNISSVLKSNSYFCLCIPDYRYCFDHYRNPTTIFDILDSYYNKRNKPSPINILESRYLVCENNSVLHWNTLEKSYNNIFITLKEHDDFNSKIKNNIIDNIDNIKKIYQNDTYIDSHVWKFTPLIFKTIIEILQATKYIDFSILRLYKTLKNSCEFYVILQKN